MSSSQRESCPPETISIDEGANCVNHFVARHLEKTFSRKAEPNLNEKEFLELLEELFANKFSNFGDFSVQRQLSCREALRKEKKAEASPISLEPLLSGLGFTSSIPTSKLINDFIESCIKSMSSATGDNFDYSEYEISSETQKLQVVFGFIINQVLSRESVLSFNEANDKEVWLRIYLQNFNSINNNFIKALKCCWFKRESIRHFYLRIFDFIRFLEETGLQKIDMAEARLDKEAAFLWLQQLKTDEVSKIGGTENHLGVKMQQIASRLFNSTPEKRWCELNHYFEALKHGTNDTRGADEILKTLEPSKDVLDFQNFLLAYCLYFRPHRPGICSSLTVFHYENGLKLDNGYKIVPVTDNSKTAALNCEYLLIEPEMVSYFDFYRDSLRFLLGETQTDSDECKNCQLEFRWPLDMKPTKNKISSLLCLNDGEDGAETSTGETQTQSSLFQTVRAASFFANSNCSVIMNTTEFLKRKTASHGTHLMFGNQLTSMDAKEIHKQFAHFLSQQGKLTDKDYIEYIGCLRLSSLFDRNEYSKPSKKMYDMISAVEKFSNQAYEHQAALEANILKLIKEM